MARSGRRRAAAPRVPQASAARPQPRATHLAALSATLVVLTLVAFGGVLTSGFVNYDDDVYVTRNAHVQKGLHVESIAWALSSIDGFNWHPLTWLSHMLDVRLFGLDAGKHHRTSLLLHASNAVLLFLLLVLMTGAVWRSVFVAGLFALHPLHVESVAWIAERKDVLSTLFWLLTLLAWISYLKSRTASRYVLVLALFASGLMAKPMLVTLPFTLLLLDFWPLRRLTFPMEPARRIVPLLREKAPLFLMSAASCVVTVVAQRRGGALQTLESFTFAERLANSALAYATYLGKTVWPASLAVFYPHGHVHLLAWPVIGSALLLVGTTAIALELAGRFPYLAFGWLWYVGTLVPVIGLVQVGAQAMADRYTYVPLVGIFIAIAWGSGELAKRDRPTRYAVASAAAGSLVALLAVTRVQAGYFHDNLSLFERAVAVTSDNWMARNNLGIVLFGLGRKEEALAQFTEALRIQPDYADAHDNLGLVLDDAGRTSEAIEHYTQAIRLNPDDAEARISLGDDLTRQGRAAEAIEQYDRALRLRPSHVEALNGMGMALARVNRFSEAIERYQQALRIRPDFADAHNNLGTALARAGRIPEALQQFQEAVRIKPDLDEARANLRNAQEALGQHP